MSRSVFTHALVGVAALAIGAAGTAGAAKVLLSGKDIKDGSLGIAELSKSAQKALKGQRGAQGPAGPQGAQGPAGSSGAPGAPGTSGSTAPALMLGTMGYDVSGPRFSAPAGGGGTSASEPGALVPVPPGTGLIARDFSASVAAAPGVGESITVTFRVNQLDTGLACTISGTATSCQAPDVTVPLSAGQRMSVRSTTTAGSGVVGFGFRIVF